MAYCSLLELKQYMGVSVTTDDALLQALIARAQASIDAHCGRWFEARTATRYYESEALDGNYLWLDEDLISVTGDITNGDSDGTAIASTEYWLWDRNSGPPYYAIRLKADSAYSWEVDTDYMISVLGEWGWSENAPEDIKQAAIRWSAYLYAQKDAPTFDTTVIPEAGVITVPKGIPRDVELLLAPYIRRAG